MARTTLGLCLMVILASNVMYEAQGHFLLNNYLKQIPPKSNEITHFVNKGLSEFAGDLERSCPPTVEFKTFFTEFRSYMTFIETTSATSTNIDAEMTAKFDGLFKAMSSLSTGKGGKSADAGALKATMLQMGKTLVEKKKSTNELTVTQKKEFASSMVTWTKTVGTFVKTACESKGKPIDISTYGLDVNVNEVAGSASSSSSTKSSSKTKESSSASSGVTFKDTTGGRKTKSGSMAASAPSDSPKTESAAAKTESAAAKSESGASSSSAKKESKSSSQSSSKSSSTTSVKQVEKETSKETMSFITELEKKYAQKAEQKTELKAFFASLEASMQASSKVSAKTAKDYVSETAATTGKLESAMSTVKSSVKAEEKRTMEAQKAELIKCLKELQEINSQIVKGKKVTSTQQTEIKQKITKWEKVTTRFVETAVSSSSSSSSSSSKSSRSSSSAASRQSSSSAASAGSQGRARMIKTN